MDTRSDSPAPRDHDVAEFVRFCYRRRRVGWPELYDEMCGVAARGLFRGMNADDLAGLGIGFSLFDMPALAALSNTIVAEEHAKRRPVAVAIHVDAPPLDEAIIEARGTASFERTVVDEPLAATAVTVQPVATEVDVTAHVTVSVGADRPVARSKVAPIRLIGVAATA